MSEPFEHGLRKAMEFLGHLVETLIGKAKQAKMQVGSRSGVQPILAVESLLDLTRVKELIEVSILKVVENQIPDLKDQMALEIGEGPASYVQRFLTRQARVSVAVEIGGASIGRQGDISRGFIIRGDSFALPFINERFSYILARMATPLQGDVVRGMHEVGRVLAPGGRGIFVDYHPFGLYSKRGTDRLRPAQCGIHRFEDYYRLCRGAGLRVVDVREVYVDEGMRKLFDEEEIQAYRHLKGTPLIVFIFFYKPKRSKKA